MLTREMMAREVPKRFRRYSKPRCTVRNLDSFTEANSSNSPFILPAHTQSLECCKDRCRLDTRSFELLGRHSSSKTPLANRASLDCSIAATASSLSTVGKSFRIDSQGLASASKVVPRRLNGRPVRPAAGPRMPGSPDCQGMSSGLLSCSDRRPLPRSVAFLAVSGLPGRALRQSGAIGLPPPDQCQGRANTNEWGCGSSTFNVVVRQEDASGPHGKTLAWNGSEKRFLALEANAPDTHAFEMLVTSTSEMLFPSGADLIGSCSRIRRSAVLSWEIRAILSKLNF